MSTTEREILFDTLRDFLQKRLVESFDIASSQAMAKKVALNKLPIRNKFVCPLREKGHEVTINRTYDCIYIVSEVNYGKDDDIELLNGLVALSVNELIRLFNLIKSEVEYCNSTIDMTCINRWLLDRETEKENKLFF